MIILFNFLSFILCDYILIQNTFVLSVCWKCFVLCWASTCGRLQAAVLWAKDVFSVGLH